MTPKIEDLSSSLPIDDNYVSQDPRIPDTIPFQSRFGQLNKLYGFEINTLGLTGERDGLKALNFDSLDLVTYEIFKVHLLKILLTMVITGYKFMQNLYETWLEFDLLVDIIIFQLLIVSNLTRRRSNLRFGNRILDQFYIIENYIEHFPPIMLKMLYSNVVCYHITGLTDFAKSIPNKFTPNSITIIFSLNLLLLPSPPPIPQPYLNASKQLQVPYKKQIQQAITLRNEYLTQNRTHIAAEKVRLSTEIGKFIVWNILQANLNVINIYEEMGVLWDNKLLTTEEKMINLSQCIINELHSFVGNCNNHEFVDILTIVPNLIVLKDKFSDYEYEITDIFDENINNDRVVVVNLCDGRLIKKIPVEGNDENIYKSIVRKLPTSTDLILIPGKNGEKFTELLGYTALGIEKPFNSPPVIYFSKLNFGFKLYCQGLFTYALMKQKHEEISIAKVQSWFTLSLSKVNSTVTHLGQYFKPKEPELIQPVEKAIAISTIQSELVQGVGEEDGLL